jgi:hypothetical protein
VYIKPEFGSYPPIPLCINYSLNRNYIQYEIIPKVAYVDCSLIFLYYLMRLSDKKLTNVKASEILPPQATYNIEITFLSSAYYSLDGKRSKIWVATYMNNRGSSHSFIHSPRTMLLYILCMGVLLIPCQVLSLDACLRKKIL